MIQITPQHQLHVCIAPIDFRCGIDRLIGLSRSQLTQDPFDGTVLAFRNRRGSAVKLLVYDGTGFWLCHKRFSKGKLKYWPKTAQDKICAMQMHVILHQGADVELATAWRALPSSNNANAV